MNAIRKQNRGFTLVEILIVVIILGILAAIVIPQFTNASEDARKSSMASSLQSIRSQLAVYKLEHTSGWPAEAEFWNKLTKKTLADGTELADNTTDPNAKGKYFDAEVKNPITGTSAIGTTVATDGSVAWIYDATNGTLHGVSKDSGGTYIVSDNGNDTVVP